VEGRHAGGGAQVAAQGAAPYCRTAEDANDPQTESTHVDRIWVPSADTVPEQRPSDGMVDRYALSNRVPRIVPVPDDRKLPRHAEPHAVK
jgi:hypothetical protein